MELLKKIALLEELLVESDTITNIVERMNSITNESYVYVALETSIVGVAKLGDYVTNEILSFGNCRNTESGVLERIKDEIKYIKSDIL